MRGRSSLFLAVLLLATSGSLRASADALDDRLATARADAVRGFEQTAAWAAEHRLIGGRHRALRRILFFAPDHAVARAVLGFSRSKKDARWIASKDYREPADWDKDALDDYDARIMKVLTTYRNDALTAVEDAAETAGARRDVVLDQLAALLPDDESVHKTRGDVRLGKRWVMVETARASERRAELEAAVRRAKQLTKPPVDDAAPLALGWKVALRSAEISVAGTLDAAACRRTIDLCQAFPAFFAAVFGRKIRSADPSSYYLLRGRAEAQSLFQRNGEAKKWDQFVAAGLGGAWLAGGEAFVIWNGDPDVTVEMALRTTVDVANLARFHHGERGWVSDGVGRALCWRFAGFTGPPIVSLDQTEVGKDDETESVVTPDGDWLPAARDALRTLPLPRFVALLTMRLTAMRTLDSLAAYALATFLLEGVPEKAAAFIEATVASDDAEKAVKTVLGFGVEALLGRLRRWTDEMTKAP